MLFKSQGKQHAAAANEEWPEIIDGKVGESRTVKINTYQAASNKQICVKNLSTCDLKSMKKSDPFLYYSIPGVRSAKILGKEIDTSDLKRCRMPRNSTSCPSRLQAVQCASQSDHTLVTRSKRVSFEIHPDVLLFEALGIFDEETDDDQASVDSDV